jgi:hypothetical protein
MPQADMDIGDWWLKERMAARGIEWNRDNYIWERWGKELPERVGRERAS